MKPVPEGKVITGSITKELDRRFLSSLDFAGSGTVGLTIDRIEKVDTLKYENGTQDDDVILCYFTEGDKPLMLCVTNIKSIIEVTGTNQVKDWAGKKIGFKAESGMYFGKKGLAVRIDHKYKGDK